MKTAGLFCLANTLSLASLAAAFPMFLENRGAIKWVTDVETTYETIKVVTTVFTNNVPVPATASPTPQATGTFSFAVPGHSITQNSRPAVTPAAVSHQAAPPVPPAQSAAPSTHAPKPAPTPAATPAAPHTPAAAAPSPSTSTPPPSSAGGETSSGYTGWMTYYAPGLGSCGAQNTASENVVALSHIYMKTKNVPNPNNNPLCGRTITVEYEGKQTQAKVVDSCTACDYNDIDLSPAAFQQLIPLAPGKVNIQWWFN